MIATKSAGEHPAMAATHGRLTTRCSPSVPRVRIAGTFRALALGGAIAVSLAIASPALSDAPATGDRDPSHWVGRYCTTSSCANSRPAPLSHAAGFGAAVLGALWLAGRRSARS